MTIFLSEVRLRWMKFQNYLRHVQGDWKLLSEQDFYFFLLRNISRRQPAYLSTQSEDLLTSERATFR